jgi:hypothetical protein
MAKDEALERTDTQKNMSAQQLVEYQDLGALNAL